MWQRPPERGRWSFLPASASLWQGPRRLQAVFSPRPPLHHPLPSKGRCQKPAPPEAGGPLQGTGARPALLRPSGPCGLVLWWVLLQSGLCQPPNPSKVPGLWAGGHSVGAWAALVCARPAPRWRRRLSRPLRPSQGAPATRPGRRSSGLTPAAAVTRAGSPGHPHRHRGWGAQGRTPSTVA